MPYLIQSIEWRLLQELGRLVRPKLARYHIQWDLTHDNIGASSQAEHFEVELRQALFTEELSTDLDQKNYDQCQTKLMALCSLMDGLVRAQSVYLGPPAAPYPRLSAFIKFLGSVSEPLDLIHGPNETLFKLPGSPHELKECLRIVSECNFALGQLLKPTIPVVTTRPPGSAKGKEAWKKARLRKHTTFILSALFKHFRCGKSHEVLLKLTKDLDEDAALPSLQFFLSLCTEIESWQEAWCESVALNMTSVSFIPDICEGLRQQAGQGKALILLPKEYALFGAWEYSASSEIDFSTKESLHQLIVDGLFKPHDLKTLLNGASPRKFSTKDKRKLAVKLGFCLMDFFDANIATKRIYLSGCSEYSSRREFTYLGFNSKIPAIPDSYNFGMGHPALLSFAKLLIEIDIGESMDLSISLHNSQNANAYFQLMCVVDRLERERDDSYVEAIRGCLMVHSEIAKELRSLGLEGEAADRRIRKKIYKKVVKKLEQGLDESTPRAVNKRQRSISPTRASYWEGTKWSESKRLASYAVEYEHAVPRNKRQRAFRSKLTSDVRKSGENAHVEEGAPLKVLQPKSTHSQTQLQPHEELAARRASITAHCSDNWFAELANMNAVVRIKPKERDFLSPQIKVAILDTGIESQHLNTIADYHDFVNESNLSCIDSTGHGTNVFLLLRKVCEDAQYFIGRVWEGSQDTAKTPILMENAIDYSREVWKVDIIVLSSGFRTAHNNIGDAIERANMARILTFAAPSNYGNLSDVYYPGRLYGLGKVICLFSTNSMVRSSTTKTFNPSPLDTAAHRTFAILGEDIIIENQEDALNGTSYSTAIGAGIAARILDFSRHTQFREKIKNIDDLKKVEGMLAVFGRMAKRSDNGYRCIAPWEICPPPEEGMERREARQHQQSAVFDELKEALKNIHRS